MEACILASELLGKRKAFCSHLEAENEAFYLHLVTKIYGDNFTDSREGGVMDGSVDYGQVFME